MVDLRVCDVAELGLGERPEESDVVGGCRRRKSSVVGRGAGRRFGGRRLVELGTTVDGVSDDGDNGRRSRWFLEVKPFGDEESTGGGPFGVEAD